MCLLLKFIEDLNEYLTGNKAVSGNIIRKHSKNLDQLGDLSFPLNAKNWSQFIDNFNIYETIFQYNLSGSFDNIDTCLEHLISKSKEWTLTVHKCKIKNNTDVQLYLSRPYITDLCIKDILSAKSTYGLQRKCFNDKISVTCDKSINCDVSAMNLTELRAKLVQDITSNFINNLSVDNTENSVDIRVTLNSNKKQNNVLICGSVLNETGTKDSTTTALELYKKRALDMQLMAQHKYGIQVKPLPTWTEYFEKLGKASITIEMLQNKIHKTIKITLNNLQSSNKGPSFIFYNCARLSALLKEFDDRILNKVYPNLPNIDDIDFSLLNQSEEWEIVFVYLLQFPIVVNNCVCDIKSGMVNIHYLVLYLSNLSSLFSVYYRRVKILTIKLYKCISRAQSHNHCLFREIIRNCFSQSANAREHLLPVLFARIYLLKAVQQVFHTALLLLNIEPVKEM